MKAATKYGFNPSFESVIAVGLARFPALYGKIGKHLDSGRLATRPAAIILDAAHAIARDTGNGPSSEVIVMQRIRRAMREGKVSREELDACFDLFASTTTLPTEDEITVEAAAIIRKVVRREVTEELLLTLPKDGDTAGIAEKLADADRIGVVDSTHGATIGEGASIEDLLSGTSGIRLPSGVFDLDLAIDGGVTANTLSIAMAGPGTGKSMFLAHIAVEAMLRGMNVGLPTLELSEREQLARVLANLTATSNMRLVSADETIRSRETRKAQARLAQILAAMRERGKALGRLYVKAFPADITTPRDLRDWISQIEVQQRTTVPLMVVDYVDLLVDGKSSSQHESQKRCATELRAWAAESKEPRWVWTASQSRGRDDGKTEYLDISDTAESMGKPRIADLFVTFKRNGETKEGMSEEAPQKILGFVAKNRFGTSRRLVGPFETDFPHGRFTPADREWDRM